MCRLMLFLFALSLSAFATAAAVPLAAYAFVGANEVAVEAQIGHFQVPENRSKSDSRQLDLVFVKLPSTAKKPGTPIVYLAGGPGGSATGTAKGARFPLFMKLREVADVILFDQRGTGLSSNGLNTCHREAWPLEQATVVTELMEKTIADVKSCVQQWQAQQIDLGGYTTRENAADLVALSQALGQERISLWGISYGTHLAFATVKYYPEIIDKMVLASLEGLDQTIKQPIRVHQLIEKIALQLRERPDTAQRYPDLVGDLTAVLKNLEQAPVQVQTQHYRTKQAITVGVSQWDVQFALSTIFLRDPEYLKQLPRIVQQMKMGNFAEIAGYVAYLKENSNQYSAMSLAMDAASGISTARWQQVLAQEKQSLVGRTSNFPFPDINTALPVTDLGDSFRQEVKSDITSLFVAGTFDGRTLYQTQCELVKNFSRAHLITVDGAGHNVFMAHPEIGQTIYDFFAGNEVADKTLVLEPLAFE